MSLDDAIVAHLDKYGVDTAATISHFLNRSHSYVYRRLRALRRVGRVRLVGHLYFLVPVA